MVTQLLTCEKCGEQYPVAWCEDACPHLPVNEMRVRALHQVTSPDGVVIPAGLADYMVRVLDAEDLPLCLVDVWQCKGEGEFDSMGPKVRIGLCPMGDGEYDEVATKKLFLHEVAHGLLDLAGVLFEESYWHREAWQKAYAALLRRHGGTDAK